VIQDEQGHFKIGGTGNVLSRFWEYTKLAAEPKIVILTWCVDWRKEEKFNQSIFAEKRIRGEWFDLSEEDINILRNISNDDGGKMGLLLEPREDCKGKDRLNEDAVLQRDHEEATAFTHKLKQQQPNLDDARSSNEYLSIAYPQTEAEIIIIKRKMMVERPFTNWEKNNQPTGIRPSEARARRDSTIESQMTHINQSIHDTPDICGHQVIDILSKSDMCSPDAFWVFVKAYILADMRSVVSLGDLLSNVGQEKTNQVMLSIPELLDKGYILARKDCPLDFRIPTFLEINKYICSGMQESFVKMFAGKWEEEETSGETPIPSYLFFETIPA
jgi:hypothetical protein